MHEKATSTPFNPKSEGYSRVSSELEKHTLAYKPLVAATSDGLFPACSPQCGCMVVFGRFLWLTILHPVMYPRSEDHTSELQSHSDLVCRLLLEKKHSASTTSAS